MVPWKVGKMCRRFFTSILLSKVELQETEQDLVEHGHGGGNWIGPKFRTKSCRGTRT